MAKMRRRRFLSVLGAAAVPWPLAVRAQQPKQMRRIGVLVGLAASADDPVADGFSGALADLAKTRASATELVALDPELIYTQGLPATLAVRQKTKSIPIVFTQVADPVGFGLAESVRHPGGNVTGFVVWDLSIGGKWMQLLREFVPQLTHVGILYNPDTAPYAGPLVASANAGAGNLQIVECHCRSVGETETAISSLSQQPEGGLLVLPEPFTASHRDQIVAQCAQFALPAVNSVIGAAEQGALLSYTFALDELIRHPVSYIDRILKGEAPSNLPIQAPNKYELAINLKTAKALGIVVPPTLKMIAEKVIED